MWKFSALGPSSLTDTGQGIFAEHCGVGVVSSFPDTSNLKYSQKSVSRHLQIYNHKFNSVFERKVIFS